MSKLLISINRIDLGAPKGSLVKEITKFRPNPRTEINDLEQLEHYLNRCCDEFTSFEVAYARDEDEFKGIDFSPKDNPTREE